MRVWRGSNLGVTRLCNSGGGSVRFGYEGKPKWFIPVAGYKEFTGSSTSAIQPRSRAGGNDRAGVRVVGDGGGGTFEEFQGNFNLKFGRFMFSFEVAHEVDSAVDNVNGNIA